MNLARRLAHLVFIYISSFVVLLLFSVRKNWYVLQRRAGLAAGQGLAAGKVPEVCQGLAAGQGLTTSEG